jgi:hypothetical protein
MTSPPSPKYSPLPPNFVVTRRPHPLLVTDGGGARGGDQQARDVREVAEEVPAHGQALHQDEGAEGGRGGVEKKAVGTSSFSLAISFRSSSSTCRLARQETASTALARKKADRSAAPSPLPLRLLSLLPLRPLVPLPSYVSSP